MSLGRIQFISLVTKSITTALGIVQSVIIVRILSPAEFGLVGLVVSIGGLIGVTQHLGIVDGAIREIAVLNNNREVGKVFWVSHLARQIVTIPLSIGLLLVAGLISVRLYGRPEIIPYLQLFAVALILQGFQDVLGATLTGLKTFGALYATQIITAAINIAVFSYLTLNYGISGFFWSIIITTTIMVVILASIIKSRLRGNLSLPSWPDIKEYGGRVIRIGAYMYLARIFFVVWQRLPILVLGGVLAADELGFINVALTFGSKLTVVAMALSEVNLSWMSTLYAHEREQFIVSVQKNLQRVLILMMGMTLVLLFFVPEILRYVIGVEYLPAQQTILLLTSAFFLYSLIDIGTSSVFVPANEPRSRAVIYGAMMAVSGLLTGWLLLVRPDAVFAAYAVLAGAVTAYVLMVALAWRRHGIALINMQLAVFLLALFGSVAWLLSEPALWLRVAIFAALSAYVWKVAQRDQLLPRLSSILAPAASSERTIICFSGAIYQQDSWTNRQHVMTELAKTQRVLYIEPRIWIIRYFIDNWRRPDVLVRYVQRLLWPVKQGERLFVKAQWNLVPGSREFPFISRCNHWLNRWHVLGVAALLGFSRQQAIVWLYDTEAAEFLSAYPQAYVVYDCVDDHAAQAGVDRNSAAVRREEAAILARANLVTVTSQHLFEQKSKRNPNVHLVPNAGNTTAFAKASAAAWPFPFANNKPVIGSVGALDAYKYDFDLLYEVASSNQQWNFVLIGQPLLRADNAVGDKQLIDLQQLGNVYVLGTVDRALVPNYVMNFNVCMIPYRNSAYNRSSFPLKFWEFMATGKPIVVSGLPELEQFSDVIAYVGTADQFATAIAAALQNPLSGSMERRNSAVTHSFEQRVAQLRALLPLSDKLHKT